MHTKVFKLTSYDGEVDIVLATKVNGVSAHEEKLLRRAGYGDSFTVVTSIMGSDLRAHDDPFDWGYVSDPFHFQAHNYIANNWQQLVSGDVIHIGESNGEV